MKASDSFLTPLYRQSPHWSKPPLHFWMGLAIDKVSPFNFLFNCRLAILLLTLGGLFLSSNLLSRINSSINKSHYLLFMGSSFMCIKYSRIFMMESPLMIFNFIAMLYAYLALRDGQRKDWIFYSIALGLAVLIKGPVSYIMVGAALFSYLCLNKSLKKDFIPLLAWSCLSLAISLPWFIQQFLSHGQPFIDYFFFRENVGKFNSKGYSPLVLFQGLIVFTLPWFPLSFYLASKKTKDLFRQDSFFKFCSLSFLVFFILWLIPSQRSHHYAIPASPFFLTILFVYTWPTVRQIPKGYRVIFPLIWSLFAVIAMVGLRFDDLIGNQWWVLILYVLLIFSSIFFCFKKKFNFTPVAISNLLIIGILWGKIASLFYLPMVPEKVALRTVSGAPFYVLHRRPFFVEERIGRPVIEMDIRFVGQLISNKKGLFYLSQSALNESKAKNFTILESWKVWKRGARAGQIWSALRSGNLANLQEKMVLVRPSDL